MSVGPVETYTETFEYDELGRLKKTIYDSTGTPVDEEYVYDPVGNRINKTVAAASGSVREGASAAEGADLTITIDIDGDLGINRQGSLQLSSDTAIAGQDFVSTSIITVPIPSGQSFVNAPPFQVLADDVFENAETILVELLEIQDEDPNNPGNYIPSTTAVIGRGAVQATITNTSSPPEFSVSWDNSNVDPNGLYENETALFTVTLTGDTEVTHAVSYETLDGTATAGQDYTATMGTLTFAPGQTTKTVQVTGLVDADDTEGLETVELRIFAPTESATITTDQDTATATYQNGTFTTFSVLATLSVQNGATEDQAAAGDFSLRRLGYVDTTHTIDWAITLGSAASGTSAADASDFGAAQTFSGTSTFNPGDTQIQIPIDVIADTEVEDHESFPVALSNATGPGALSLPLAESYAWILNDDLPATPVAFAIDPLTSAGGEASGVAFTITRTGDTNSTHRVGLQTTDGTAVASSGDYVPFNSSVNSGFPFNDRVIVEGDSIVFGSGETAKMVTVHTSEDGVPEDDETFTLTLSGATAQATVSATPATGTILDQDIPAVVSIAPLAQVVEGETGTLQVTRSHGFGSLDVTLEVTPVRATSADYILPASLTITFEPGETSLPFDVQTFDDADEERIEWLMVSVASVTDPSEINPTASFGRILINDNDGPPPGLNVVYAEGGSADEGAQGSIILQRSGDTSAELVLNYSVVPATADLSDLDAFPGTGQVTIPADQSLLSLPIGAQLDFATEQSEFLIIEFNDPAGQAAFIGAAPSFSITDVPVSQISVADAHARSGAINFIVSRTGDTSHQQTVRFKTHNAKALAGSDYVSLDTIVLLEAGNATATVPVSIYPSNSSVDEIDEQFFVTLSEPTGGAEIQGEMAVGTITSGNQPNPYGLGIGLAGNSVIVEGQTARGQLYLNTGFSRDTSMHICVSIHHVDTSPADFRFGPNPTECYHAHWEWPQDMYRRLVPVGTQDDLVPEDDELFYLYISSQQWLRDFDGAFLGTRHVSDSIARFKIVDNDGEVGAFPTIRVSDVTISENEPFIHVTLERTGDISGNTWVSYATQPGTAEGGGVDFYDSSGTVRFYPNQTTNTKKKIYINNTDQLPEATEEFYITLTSVTPDGAIEKSVAKIVINDDDGGIVAASQLSLSGPTAPTLEGQSAQLTFSSDGAALSEDRIIEFGFLDVTATADADYTRPTPQRVTLPAGSTSTTFNVPILSDGLPEPDDDESFVVFLVNVYEADGLTIADDLLVNVDASAANVLIRDLETSGSPPIVSIASSSIIVPEGDEAQIPITRIGGIDSAVTVFLSSEQPIFEWNGIGVAANGVDFTPVSDVQVDFAPGETGPLYVPIQTHTDTTAEFDEHFVVNLSVPQGSPVQLNRSSARVVIEEAACSNGEERRRPYDSSERYCPANLFGTVYSVQVCQADGTWAAGPDDVSDCSPVSFSMSQLSLYQSEGTDFEFDIVRSGDTSTSHTVGLDTNDGTASAANGDYLPRSSVVSVDGATGETQITGDSVFFDIGETEKTVFIRAETDQEIESLENFSLGLTGATGDASVDRAYSVATIEDNTQPPPPSSTAFFAMSPLSVTDSEANGITFTIVRTGDTSTSHTVGLDTTDGSATASSGDYTPASSVVSIDSLTGELMISGDTVTFEAGDTSKTFKVITSVDSDIEPLENFSLRLTGATGGADVDTTPSVGTITDSTQIPPPTSTALFSMNPLSATGSEGGDITFTIVRSGDLSTSHTVGLDTTDGTALAANDDYAEKSSSISIDSSTNHLLVSGDTVFFDVGISSLPVTVAVPPDSEIEGSENFSLRLTGATGGAGVDTTPSVGTIQDTTVPPPPTSTAVYRMDPLSVTGQEGSSIRFTIVRTGDDTIGHTLGLDTNDGTASAAAGDYTAKSSTINGEVVNGDSVFFPAGETSIFVDIETDANAVDGAPSENFSLGLTGVTGGASVESAYAVATITDTPSGVTEACTNDLGYLIQNDPGNAQLAYSPLQDAETYCPDGSIGEEQRICGIQNPYEWGPWTLTNPACTLPPTAPAFSISADTSVTEGGTATLTVTRTGDPAVAVDVSYVISGSGANPADGSDITSALSGTLSFAANQTTKTIDILTGDDQTFEPDETLTVTLSNPTGGASISNGTATVTITNNDAAPPPAASFRMLDSSISGNEDTTFEFTIVRDGDLSTSHTVGLDTNDGSASAAAGDYEAKSSTVNGGTISGDTVFFGAGVPSVDVLIDVFADSEIEQLENFSLGLTGATNGASITGAYTVATITDTTEPPPPTSTAVFSMSPLSVMGQEGSAIRFTIVRTGDDTTGHTLGLDTNDGTASAAAGDYTAKSSTISGETVNGDSVFFPANQPSIFVDIQTAANAVDGASSENFSLGLTGVTGGASVDSAYAVATITDTPPPSCTPQTAVPYGDPVAASCPDLSFPEYGINIPQTGTVQMVRDYMCPANAWGTPYADNSTLSCAPTGSTPVCTPGDTTNPQSIFCPANHSGSASQYQTCDANGQWGSMQQDYSSCTPFACTPGETTQPQSKSCQAGYSGGTEQQVCGSNGQWGGFVEVTPCTPDAPACTDTSETRTLSCPDISIPEFGINIPQTGNIFQQRNYTCSGSSGSWGNWFETSNTCTPAGTMPVCSPGATENQTLSCAAGYSGSITETRTCSGAGQWGGWSETANTCVPDAPSCTPGTEIETRSCGELDAGLTGTYEAQRTRSCPGPTFSAWTPTGNNLQCTPLF